MYAYSGRFDYADDSSGLLNQDSCQVSFDAETCVITPGSGVPLLFDLGDVDSLAQGEWDMQIRLYTGRHIHLRQFGKLFSRMSGELLAAWRDRTVRCLLLEDLAEVARFEAVAEIGAAPAAPAQIRLYKSNIAVLPVAGAPCQWRLADVDSVSFDNGTYSVTLVRGGERLVISKLAKRTDEFVAKLRGSVNALREQSARALNDLFPFLGPDKLQRLLAAMPEGHTVRLGGLAAIHPKLAEALLAQAVDKSLKPYFDALRCRAVADSLMAGFKFIREEQDGEEDAESEPAEDQSGEPESDDAAPEEQEEKNPLFFWFFIPMAAQKGSYGNAIAWEASTGSGRATYFFRAVPQVESGALADSKRGAALVEDAVARLTRGLALVNFRREPVYLSDDSLERQPRFRRYAIGSRKLPDLRALRQAMLGRAIHSSLDEWTAQVESTLARVK